MLVQECIRKFMFHQICEHISNLYTSSHDARKYDDDVDKDM
jgi:hypothetical protein